MFTTLTIKEAARRLGGLLVLQIGQFVNCPYSASQSGAASSAPTIYYTTTSMAQMPQER